MKDIGLFTIHEDTHSITPTELRILLFEMNKWPLDYYGLTFRDIIKEENTQLYMDKRAFYYGSDKYQKKK
jgi:hypothetical protein